ncbi:MAG: hypothetical protein LBF40_05925 [Deltaproteobacteria bacterium]|jgi:hypothetical protein|nr:hypothetical protein [Deltaproteobacteria bacterium]
MGSTYHGPDAYAYGDGKYLDEMDWAIFEGLTCIELTEGERLLATTPGMVDVSDRNVMALHFHPEWVPIGMIDERLRKAFPNAKGRLAIPTQHNIIQGLDSFSGVEADVFCPECGAKLQFLIHLKSHRLNKPTAFASMIERTFRYRALQLLDILHELIEPGKCMAEESDRLGFDITTAAIARIYASKLLLLIEKSGIVGTLRAGMLKNRLLTDFICKRAMGFGKRETERLLEYVNRMKKLVKARLDPDRFHTPKELIEEARSLGAGVVIPHPPRFWPALLCDLDVDGWEVWNPSTPDHVMFLIDCLGRRKPGKREPLAFMGDDTHMSAKIRPETLAKKISDQTEIGFQPPWDQAEVQAALKAAGQSRERTLNEYLERIS